MAATFMRLDTKQPVTSILDKARGLGMPQMVKIDAEGLDLKVLAGASDLLGKTEVFLVEATICAPLETSAAEVMRFMSNAGYQLIDIRSEPQHEIRSFAATRNSFLAERQFLVEGHNFLRMKRISNAYILHHNEAIQRPYRCDSAQCDEELEAASPECRDHLIWPRKGQG